MGGWISKEEGNIHLENQPAVKWIGRTVIIKRPEIEAVGTEGEIQIKESNISKNFLQELSSDVGDMDGVLYVDSILPEIDSVKDQDYFNTDTISLERKGATQTIINKVIMDLAVKKLNKEVGAIYLKEGQFKFRKIDLDELDGIEENLENRDVVELENWFYLGQWNKTSNLREGKGVTIFKDGSLYEGLWKEGERSGVGRMIYSDASVYQGEWYKDIPNGYGVLISKEMGNLKGYWLDGKIHGQGFEIMTNGNTYRGDYINGRKEGKGVFIWEEGNMYTGEFKDNKMEGYGVYLYNIKGKSREELNFEVFNDKKYKGCFKDNLMNGKGIFYWPDGRIYEGEYLNDKKHGMGEFKWPNSKRYIGEWKDGLQNGMGKFINDSNGVTFTGIWKNGKVEKINK